MKRTSVATSNKLRSEWSSRNALEPRLFSLGSGKKAWWRCPQGHEWQAVISSRAYGYGCPYCAGQKLLPENSFASRFPKESKDWHPTKNQPILPPQVSYGSQKRYWWLCKEGHEYSANPNNRSNGKGCPYCSNKKTSPEKSLLAVAPRVAREWHPTKNGALTSDNVVPGSNRRAWWQCKRGHEWNAVIVSRTKMGLRCPFCAGRKASAEKNLSANNPALAREWHPTKNGKLQPKDVTQSSGRKVWWICSRGHSWPTSVGNRNSSGTGCPNCTNQTSLNEIRLYCEIAGLFKDTVRRAKVNGMEADAFNARLGIAFEYDGSYFHRGAEVRDKRKNMTFKAAGICLIRVRQRPLRLISKRDVLVASNQPLKKTDIDAVLDRASGLLSRKDLAAVRNYKKRTSFVATRRYRELVSCLPGPGIRESLLKKVPRLGKEWNYAKNSPLIPEMYHPRSGQKVWWICSTGHEWQATIDKRTSGRNCPYCSNKKLGYGNSLADRSPQMAREWYQPGNGKLRPHMVTAGAGIRVWWRCSQNHIFQAGIATRFAKKTKCPHCPGRGRNRRYVPPRGFSAIG